MSIESLTIKEKILQTFEGKEGRIFRPHEVIDLILEKFPDTNKSSINLADRCYNRTNKDVEKRFNFHVFEAQDDGSYKFLGEGKPFTGPIKWKGKIVGEWVNGKIVRLNNLE